MDNGRIAVRVVARHVVRGRPRRGGGFMPSAFLRDGDDVYRTYSTTARGVDRPQHPTYG
jgi:hypothetical protein